MNYMLDQSDPKMFQTAQALLIGKAGVPVGVGLWHQTRKLSSDLDIGDIVVQVDTTNIDFRVGDAAVIWRDWDMNETVTVEEITDTSITLVSPVTKVGFAEDTYIVPVQICTSEGNPSFSRWRNNVSEFQVAWSSNQYSADLEDHTALYPTTFQGEPVFDDDHLMGKSLSESLNSQTHTIDGGTGIKRYIKDGVVTNATQKIWDTDNMEQAMAVRKFFYWARGMQKSFWYPTNRRDLSPVDGQALGSGDNAMVVEGTGYATDIFPDGGPYNNVRITLNDGTTLYRTVVSAQNNFSAGTDTIEFSEVFGQEIPDGSISEVCFLMHARMSGDTVKLVHSGQGTLTTSQMLVGVKQ
jgi:hypothetical protein